jgi:hypothetical protein
MYVLTVARDLKYMHKENISERNKCDLQRTSPVAAIRREIESGCIYTLNLAIFDSQN